MSVLSFLLRLMLKIFKMYKLCGYIVPNMQCVLRKENMSWQASWKNLNLGTIQNNKYFLYSVGERVWKTQSVQDSLMHLERVYFTNIEKIMVYCPVEHLLGWWEVFHLLEKISKATFTFTFELCLNKVCTKQINTNKRAERIKTWIKINWLTYRGPIGI